MRKGKNVIGQDVYTLSGGLKLQSVKDLLIGESNDRIIALLVDEGGLLSTSTVVPIESVRRFGRSAVMIEEANAVVPASSVPEVSRMLDRKASLLGTRVLTEDGAELGSVSDMYFDDRSGTIHGFEVSGGPVDDLLRGSSYLPLDEIEVVGTDAVIVRESAKASLEAQAGGLAGALGQASPAEGGRDDGEQADAADPDARLIGRMAAADVADPDGSIVVAHGQRITPEHIGAARDAEVLDALRRAGGAQVGPSGADQASETLDQVAANASDMWGRFTARLSEMTDAAGQRIDQQQTKARLDAIHDAIGRPVTKVFLDKDDEVILDLGDLVTHQAVQRAYDAGMLDSLLASVYKADVTFERDEMRAPVEGDSTIEKASGGATVVEDLARRAAGPGTGSEAAVARESSDPGAGGPATTAGRGHQTGDAAKETVSVAPGVI
jgi:uncharacterized protein YrrD